MLASASDQGELTVWHTERQRPMLRANIISNDPWLMTCAFEHRESVLLSAGGLEGKLHLFRLSKTDSEMTLSEHPQLTLHAHDSYISKCEFLTSIELLSASGDFSCKLWSLQQSREPIRTFEGHSEDVMSLAVTFSNPSIFVSGSCDSTTRV